MRILTRKDIKLPKRRPDSRKGDNGRVLIVGGSEEYVGAVALAGLAAARSGADLVTIAAPAKVAWAINCLAPDLITVKLPGKHLGTAHYARIRALARKTDVVLLGNGAGLAPGTKALLRRLARLPNPKVIDADALKAIGAQQLKDAIITPHRKELERFLKNSRLPPALEPAALQRNLKGVLQHNVLLFKSPQAIVIAKDRMARNRTGNPGMTRGGTGDVLAGLCAGYYAQLRDPWQAACNAAYINGAIADLLLRRKKGYTYLASDMVEELLRHLHETA